MSIGNGGLNHPYKKVEVGKEEFKHIIQNIDVTKQDTLIEELINFLKSKKRYAKLQNKISIYLNKTSNLYETLAHIQYFQIVHYRCLPDSELQKKNPKEYKDLSSIFVSGKDYGTRTHSILLVDGSNRITFVEETLMPDFTWKRQKFQNDLICGDRN